MATFSTPVSRFRLIPPEYDTNVDLFNGNYLFYVLLPSLEELRRLSLSLSVCVCPVNPSVKMTASCSVQFLKFRPVRASIGNFLGHLSSIHRVVNHASLTRS